VGQYELEEQVFSPSGAAALWRADALGEIGLFDETFFAYYEDVDLGFRARLAGYECWYAPRAVVLHHRGGSGGDDAFTLYHHVRNRWLLLGKDAPAGLLVRNLPRIAAGEVTWWARARQSGSFRPLLRAYRDALRASGRVWVARRRIQSKRRISVGELTATMTDAQRQSSRRTTAQ
jgi:hypothetical protein